MPMQKDLLLGQHVGERLQAARRNNNLSQKELGNLIGTSAQQILKYEKALDVPSLSRLVQLATALNMPLSFFLEGHVISREIANTDNRDIQNILIHAYGVLNHHKRMLLLAIAEALVECSSTDRVHRPGKAARSRKDRAGEVRETTTSS
jgi:transcriptional regulator with XRE-family HTH domain